MTRRMARYALLTALAMVLSWLESLVPVSAAAPGVKLGLTNLVVIFALYRMGLRAAAAVSLARVGLVSMTFGNAYSFAYSLAGAALSLAVMALLRRTGRFSILGVSVAGGVSHNIAQILVAVAALGTGRLAWYLPALLVSGVAAGVAIGAVGGVLTERIKIYRKIASLPGGEAQFFCRPCMESACSGHPREQKRSDARCPLKRA